MVEYSRPVLNDMLSSGLLSFFAILPPVHEVNATLIVYRVSLFLNWFQVSSYLVSPYDTVGQLRIGQEENKMKPIGYIFAAMALLIIAAGIVVAQPWFRDNSTELSSTGMFSISPRRNSTLE